MSQGVSRALAQRAELGPGAVVDLLYSRLTKEPGTALPELFEQLGAPWGAEDDANLVAALDEPRTRPPHEYSLQRFGLDEAEVYAAFPDYMALVADLPGGAGAR